MKKKEIDFDKAVKEGQKKMLEHFGSKEEVDKYKNKTKKDVLKKMESKIK